MSNTPSTVDVVETDLFREEVEKHLSEHELGALRTYLANNPSAGTPSREMPGLIYLEWGKQHPCKICYMVQGSGEVIFLVAIYGYGESEPGASGEHGDKVKWLLKKVRDAGVGVLLKEIWEYVEDLFKND